MGRLLLFENEDLVQEFRPHAIGHLVRHLGALAWLIPGAAGTLVALLMASERATAWGAATFAVVALTGGVVNARLRGRTLAWTWFGSLLACAYIVFDLFAGPSHPLLPWVPIALGAALAVLRLAAAELDRRAQTHSLTTGRLVLRGGTASRRERSLRLDLVKSVRGERGVLGRILDYGDIVLVLSKHTRGKDAKTVEETERLETAPRFELLKHQIETLVDEARLPAREQAKRRDERRLKESMHSVATWMQRERPAEPRP